MNSFVQKMPERQRFQSAYSCVDLQTFRIINTFFEAVACVLAWANVAAAMREKPKGVFWPSVAFSVVWGVFCVPYYMSHDEVFACVFALIRDAANAAWCVLALRSDRRRSLPNTQHRRRSGR